MDTPKTTLEYAQKMYAEGKHELGTLALIDMHLDNKVSLRDQFAMAALQAMGIKYNAFGEDMGTEYFTDFKFAAMQAYKYADAMLKVREEK